MMRKQLFTSAPPPRKQPATARKHTGGAAPRKQLVAAPKAPRKQLPTRSYAPRKQLAAPRQPRKQLPTRSYAPRKQLVTKAARGGATASRQFLASGAAPTKFIE